MKRPIGLLSKRKFEAFVLCSRRPGRDIVCCMGYWGKIIGGTAGFFVGGPYGAVIGAALGHAADSGRSRASAARSCKAHAFNPARVAGMLGRREEVFAITVTVLAAKLCKCDGPVKRIEIDAFKRNFRIPPASARGIGRLFDQARDSTDSFEPYAAQLAEAFADTRGVLEQVLGSLFNIARADGPLNAREQDFLRRVHRRFGLDQVPGTAPSGKRRGGRCTSMTTIRIWNSASPGPRPGRSCARHGSG